MKSGFRTSILASSIVAVSVLAGSSAFAQNVSSGTGDAAAQNQRSTVGVDLQSGNGGSGYPYNWGLRGAYYGAPAYSGRSAVVTPYGSMAPIDPQ